MTATTLDSVRKVNNNLSGGGLVATSIGAGGVGTSRFVQDNVYAEFTITTLTGVPVLGFLYSQGSIGASPQGLLYGLGYDPSGAVKMNSVTIATIAAYVQGNRVDMALNPRMKLVWFRVNNGNWNNSAGANPATNTGGIDWSAMTIQGTWQLAVYASVTGNVWTTVFSAASFAGVAPAGYSSLDNVNPLARSQSCDSQVPPALAVDYGSGGVAKSMPGCVRAYKLFTPAGVITKISGVVKELGVVVAGRLVEAYDRITGDLLGRAYSAADGSYSIPCLGRPTVRVVASDPTTYNSLAFDNVTPA